MSEMDPNIVKVAAAYHMIEKAKELLRPTKERITVGRFTMEKPGPLSRPERPTIWIEDGHGAGVEFLEEEWEWLIEKYFDGVIKPKPKTKT